MKADIERWNRKYAEAEADSAPEVEPLLLDYRYLLNGKGTALDGCGRCRDSVRFETRRLYSQDNKPTSKIARNPLRRFLLSCVNGLFWSDWELLTKSI